MSNSSDSFWVELLATPLISTPFVSSTWIVDKNIPVAAEDPKPDERLPDWHGPRDHYDPGYPVHKRVYDTATDLLNGRVTDKGAREELRKSLDHADKIAKPTPPLIGRR